MASLKLIRAKFHNFRLLRDLEVDFSTEADRNLTVLRAANETGKTTILIALQWALYGDDALPGKGEDYRLHPIDWNVSDSRRVQIDVVVEFETISSSRSTHGTRQMKKRYRVVRTAVEQLHENRCDRTPSTAKLFELTETGAEPIDYPEALIADELPTELREVFFTDGDRALSFIEAATETKRQRVEMAIRSLLGLKVIEEGRRHIKQVAGDVNKQVRVFGKGEELERIAKDYEEIDTEISELEENLARAKEQFANFDVKYDEKDKAISAALRKGDQEELDKELIQCKEKINQQNKLLASLDKQHSGIFKSANLARDLLTVQFERVSSMMEKLRDQRKIPSATIPVLEEHLRLQACICGETLDPAAADGLRRRGHIERLIETNRKDDDLQRAITELYYRSQSLLYDTSAQENRSWIEEYASVLQQRENVEKQLDGERARMRSLEVVVEGLKDVDVKTLRETKAYYREERDRFNAQMSMFDTQLADRKRTREDAANKRIRLLREQKKGQRLIADLQVTNDLLGILNRTYDRIKNEELSKVSVWMNDIFLEMIGADPKQGSLIRRASISPDFEILVFGPNDRRLTPDKDLNGASRRALTLAFILALTKVSGTEAPNIIDTPLGMMSGFVKRSVLRAAIAHSSQLILFLTRAEIAGCEDILDKAAGKIITLTNPAHYPRMLVHDPGVSSKTILRCECDHHQSCKRCERRKDAPDMVATLQSDERDG